MSSARRRRGSFARIIGAPADEHPRNHAVKLRFNNSERDRLYVPGFAGIPLDVELPAEDRFAHAAHDWAQPRLTAREVAMLQLMNDITDLPGWNTRIIHEDARDLRSNASYAQLISDATWDWCMTELRDKAAEFQRTGFVSVLDTACSVVKSDGAVSDDSLELLNMHALSEIAAAVQAVGKPHEPGLTKVLDPDMYPLVFGKTPTLTGETVINRAGAAETIGKGSPAPEQPWVKKQPWTNPQPLAAEMGFGEALLWGTVLEAVPYLHSHTLQWLPCDVSLREDKPTITSYINNLHPTRHKLHYGAIETIIKSCLDPWSEVLVQRDGYRKPRRLQTFGVQWQPPYPAWAWQLPALDRRLLQPGDEDDEIFPRVDADRAVFAQLVADAEEKVQQFQEQPTDPGAGRALQSFSWSGGDNMETKVQLKHHTTMKVSWVHPEPGFPLSYEQWKRGETNGYIIPPRFPRKEHLRQAQWRPASSLANTYRQDGLQVVISMASIDLTPDKPECGEDDSRFWLTDGMQNEHIAATTIVCLSSENMQPYGITFSTEADLDIDEIHGLPEDACEVEAVFGLTQFDSQEPHSIRPDPDSEMENPGDEDNTGRVRVNREPKYSDRQYFEMSRAYLPVQRLGSVSARPGRLVTMPAVLRRSEDSRLRLANPMRSGHMRFLILRLVDPNYRICSTANVPPQQHSWWADAARIENLYAAGKLPREVSDMIADEIRDWPMGEAEAKAYAARRAHEEKLYMVAADIDIDPSYNLGLDYD